MGLLTEIISLPLAPVRVARWAAEQIQRQAEEEYFNPAVIRQQITEVDEAYAAGQLTDEQRDELHQQLLDRLFEAQNRTGEM